MQPQQKKTLTLLLALGLVFFAVFIPANLTGAQDAGMLALFEVDEYAQFPHVMNMLTPGDGFYQSLRNFLIYLHYFYGYPFYFFSALALLPVKLLLGADWTAQVPLIMVSLRQVINVLPMLAALGLLVYIQTKFKSAWRSAGLFALLAIIPAVTLNNLWWHPDSLVFFFIILTFFFLDRDDLQFGWNFTLAAAACGLATGTKHLGLFFALAIPLYLLWGVLEKRLTWSGALGKAALFVAVMAAAVVASNPLLLLPQERAEIIAVQQRQVIQTGTGIFIANQEGFFDQGYPADLRMHYGELAFLLLGFGGLALGLRNPQKRRLHALILAWMIPMTAIILTSGTRRTHYFLPVLLPLFSCLLEWFPEQGWFAGQTERAALWARRALTGLAAVIVLGQAALFLRTDVDIYTQTLTREQTSPSIAFADKLEQNVFARIGLDRQLVVYRDWRIYLPPSPERRVEMNWDLATQPYMRDLNPDVIVLERENVALFSKDETVAQAVNPGDMQALHDFYAAAGADQLPGYLQVYSDSFGVALMREGLVDQMQVLFE